MLSEMEGDALTFFSIFERKEKDEQRSIEMKIYWSKAFFS